MSVLADLTLDELLALPDPTPVIARRARKLTLAEMRDSANASDKQTRDSAYQHEHTTSDKPRLSRSEGVGLDAAQVDALVTYLVAARAARGDRKAMRRPARRRGQADLFDVVRLHLRRLCRRVLNDRCRDGLEPPSLDLLSAALEGYLREHCWHLVYFQDYGDVREPQRVRRAYLDGERAVQSVARVSARYALETWSPDYIIEMQRRGRIGGRISKRGPDYTEADLDALQTLDGLTVVQQAKRMGKSKSTIDRMRRALKDRESGIER